MDDKILNACINTMIEDIMEWQGDESAHVELSDEKDMLDISKI